MSQSGQTGFKYLTAKWCKVFKVCLTILGHYALKLYWQTATEVYAKKFFLMLHGKSIASKTLRITWKSSTITKNFEQLDFNKVFLKNILASINFTSKNNSSVRGKKFKIKILKNLEF